MTNMPAWTVAEAKAKFSQVIERARTGPQTITRNGRPAAVVVSRLSNGNGEPAAPALWWTS